MNSVRKPSSSIERPAVNWAAVLSRRQFLERLLFGAAVITTSWLAADLLYENYGGNFEEEWLRAYYKSDFVGV